MSKWTDEHPEEAKAYRKAYYQKNMAKAKASSKAWIKAHPRRAKATRIAWRLAHPTYVAPAKRATLEFVRNAKREPCVDCGGEFPPECMDFDHIKGPKLGEVAHIAKAGSMVRVLAEMAKCELVCANCHRTRTKNRHNGGRNEQS